MPRGRWPIIGGMEKPLLPPALTRLIARASWLPGQGGGSSHAVTAVMLGERCLAVRVEAGRADAPPRVVDAAEGGEPDLARWRSAGMFKGARPVLVLRSADRQLQVLDRPEVPAAELAAAVRWPLAAALEADGESLLATAVEMPRINDTTPPQVLAVAAQVDAVKGQLARLDRAGITVRSIDAVDSALRGMRLLLPPDNDGWLVLAMVGGDVSIGLLWHGRFCALRTLGLPVRVPRDTHEFEEHLALHIQRTADLFERQARRLAIRHVLAALPALSPTSRQAVQASLPMATRLFALDEAFEINGTLLERCADDNELTALACVAAARLHDARHPTEPVPELEAAT